MRVMPMMIAVNAITAVAIQPIHRRPSWMGNFPMILGLPVICIMATMIGTATIPLITDVESSSQAAEALRPVAGPFAFTLFALGIVGTGLLAVPVLAGSAAYAISEAWKWPVGLGRKPEKAKELYVTLALATLLGVALNFSPINPSKARYWSAVINGIVAFSIMEIGRASCRERGYRKVVS